MNTQPAQPIPLFPSVHRVTAFEHAYETAKSFASCHPDATIVHGVHQTPYNGREFVHYWHAWMEVTSLLVCIEHRPGLRLSVPRDVYYRVNRVTDSPATLRRYTIAQVEALYAQHGHYGPFPPSNTEGTADVVTQPPATEIQSAP